MNLLQPNLRGRCRAHPCRWELRLPRSNRQDSPGRPHRCPARSRVEVGASDSVGDSVGGPAGVADWAWDPAVAVAQGRSQTGWSGKRFNRRYSREGGDTLSIWATVFQIPVSQDFRRILAGAGITADSGQSVFSAPLSLLLQNCFSTLTNVCILLRE